METSNDRSVIPLNFVKPDGLNCRHEKQSKLGNASEHVYVGEHFCTALSVVKKGVNLHASACVKIKRVQLTIMDNFVLVACTSINC